MATQIAQERDLVITRLFDAPRELVWKSWTDPKEVAHWWGPHGFTNPRCDWDARPSGRIYIDMRGPDGTTYPMTGRFKEVIAPERLSFVSAAPDENGDPIFEVLTTVTFTEQKGKTTQTLTASVIRKTAAAEQYLVGMEAGWGQSLERLEHLVTGVADRQIFAVRMFDAPRDLVWKVWTEPEQIKHWWGPNGFTSTIHKMDVREGGEWDFIMHGPDGTDYKNKIIYRELVKPERMVYDHVSGPHFHVTITFTEFQGKTILKMQSIFETAELRNRVIEEYGALEGMNQHLARLGEYLKQKNS